jgi:parallel beta-helix repeat protein
VKNSDYGIYLLSSSENTIRENSIWETNSSGVWLDSSSNHNILDGNEFLDSGLFVSFSYGNIAERNTVNGKPLVLIEGVTGSTVNYAGQVVLIACTNMRVENLDLSATAVGLELWQSNNSRIVGNKIAGNHFGILLYGSSNNDVLANTINNNDNGIQLWSSSNNRFWHNNLVDNKNHVHDPAWDDQEMVSSTSIWDMGYPSGGNYWNDYTGTDLYGGPFLNEAGSDGIGDSPRVIRGKELDNYPLMGTFSDFNASSEHHVQTICNSSISNFQYNGSAVYFDVKGTDGTIGFCRIEIPTALVNKPYKVFVNGTDVLYHELSCSNGTLSCLYFTYNHSTENVVIIPEFNLFMMIALSTIAALQMAMLNKKKSERHHVPV